VNKRELSRELALSRPCPKCGAGVGLPCVGRRHPRKAPHIQRYRETKPARKHAGTSRVAERGVGMSEASKLPGLYPWLRFEGVTRAVDIGDGLLVGLHDLEAAV
jgi:hypothetical protein